MMLRGIGRLVTGNASQSEVGGPVRIAEFAGDAARQGFASFLIFTAVISINLGLINLLPVPVLDGGHLLMFMIEGVRGKPLPERLQSVLMRGGMAILMSLMIVVTFFDLFRFVSS
jgi:regulator of sigma E protease